MTSAHPFHHNPFISVHSRERDREAERWIWFLWVCVRERGWGSADQWERYHFKDLGLIRAEDKVTPCRRSVLLKGKRSNNIRGGALSNIGNPVHTYNLCLPSDGVSLTLAHIRSLSAMGILQTCSGRAALLGLVTISTQTHILLDHVCRTLRSVNRLQHYEYLSETTVQKKNTERIPALSSHLEVWLSSLQRIHIRCVNCLCK